MQIDGVTLLIICLCLCGLITTIWLITALVFKSSPKSSMFYAIGNFGLGLCMLLYVWRGSGPTLLAYVGSDLALFMGLIFIRMGSQEFTNTARNDKLTLFLFLLILGLSAPARFIPGGHTFAVFVICIYSTYLIFQNAQEGYRYMIRDFKRIHCLITLSPLYMLSLFYAIRAVLLLIMPSQVVNLLQSSSFLVSFTVVMIFGISGFNVAAIGLVISRMISQIRHLSIEDSLTQTFNRRHINEMANKEIGKMSEVGSEFSVIMLDIDHFKKVNDVYGHAAGDAALVTCANVLKEMVRAKDYVGRLGGEEFCLMLPNTPIEEAKQLAESIRQKLEETFVKWEDKVIPITASFGVSSLVHRDEWSKLLNKADLAMYQAKNNGRNQVVIA